MPAQVHRMYALVSNKRRQKFPRVQEGQAPTLQVVYPQHFPALLLQLENTFLHPTVKSVPPIRGPELLEEYLILPNVIVVASPDLLATPSGS